MGTAKAVPPARAGGTAFGTRVPGRRGRRTQWGSWPLVMALYSSPVGFGICACSPK